MKVAICGAHETGKTTLVERLAEALPGYRTVDEPYVQLAEEGHAFSDLPGIDEFELQLERSLRSVNEAQGNTIFDRSPLDFLAYLQATGGEIAHHLPRVRESIAELDLLVFVPIEQPDRIEPTAHLDLRRTVDEAIRSLMLDDELDLGLRSVEVAGTVGDRVQQVFACVGNF